MIKSKLSNCGTKSQQCASWHDELRRAQRHSCRIPIKIVTAKSGDEEGQMTNQAEVGPSEWSHALQENLAEERWNYLGTFQISGAWCDMVTKCSWCSYRNPGPVQGKSHSWNSWWHLKYIYVLDGSVLSWLVVYFPGWEDWMGKY